jgi:hypothetical protein
MRRKPVQVQDEGKDKDEDYEKEECPPHHDSVRD